MGRTVVLDQGADGGGEHFAVMGFLLPARLVAAYSPGSIDDGVDRDRDALLAKAVTHGGVVVSRNGDLGILDQVLLAQQLDLDGPFCLRRKPLRWRSIVGDGESLAGGLVTFPQREETRLADRQRLLHLSPADQSLGIGMHEKGDLLNRETLVKLCHGCLQRAVEAASMGVHFSNENGSLLN